MRVRVCVYVCQSVCVFSFPAPAKSSGVGGPGEPEAATKRLRQKGEETPKRSGQDWALKELQRIHRGFVAARKKHCAVAPEWCYSSVDPLGSSRDAHAPAFGRNTSPPRSGESVRPLLRFFSVGHGLLLVDRRPAKMARVRSFRGGAVLFVLACFAISSSTAYPLCAKNLEAPGKASRNLTFCSAPAYAASGCCSAADDNQIKAAYNALNISDATCGALMKQILCSKCDAYSADLYAATLASPARPVPYLCSNGTEGYCNQVWSACANVNITNSPFEPGLATTGSNSSSKASAALNSFYSNETDFCSGSAPVPSDGSFCFNGTPFVVPAPVSYTPPAGMCLERLDNASAGHGYYLNLVPHPDGSDRVFVNTQDGHMYLVNVSTPGTGKPFGIDYTKPFLNITARTVIDSNSVELGFMGIAFHPNFVNNGRFFVSYNCDSQKWPDCKGQCGCSSVDGCNITVVGSSACRYSAVVAEYTVNATGVTPATATQANPVEVRRIFTYGLPYTNHHAGGLWFGPADKYLYYPLGDGGSEYDPWNNGQRLHVPLGKMMRLDIDNFPASTTGLFGNYSIPRDNPFYGVNNTRAEIWAYGLRNPWRCSFDRQQPSYFYCADVGQDTIEEVDLISKGGNYGWSVYEGTNVYKPSQVRGGVTAVSSINAIRPIIEYNHSVGISVCGGYVSYSRQDACAYGNYIFGDLNGAQWSAFENPPESGQYTVSKLPYQCSPTTPIPCDAGGSIDGIISYGEDAKGDIYLLGVNGAYRMVSPSQCGITCKTELPEGLTPAPAPAPGAPAPAPSHASSLFVILRNSAFCLLLAFCALVWL